MPHIVQAPIFFQRIGNAARTRHHMFRTRFSFSFFSNHIRKQCHHRFTDIACVIELSRIKIRGQVFHQQLASLCGVVGIVSHHMQLVGILVKNALCLSTEFLNKLHTQKVTFECIYFGLTNNLIRERIVEITTLRYNVLNLVSRGKQLGQRDGPTRIWRHILLVEPQLITPQFATRRLCQARNLSDVFVFVSQVFQCALFVYFEQLALRRRIRPNIADAGVILQFGKQQAYAHVGVFVALYGLGVARPLLGRSFHIAPKFNVYLVYLPFLLPHISNRAQGF